MWAWKPVRHGRFSRRMFGAHGQAQRERHPARLPVGEGRVHGLAQVLLAREASHGIVDEHRIELAD